MGVRAASTNAASDVVHFEVDRYEVAGNTLLPKRVVDRVFTRHTGTNVTFDDVAAAEKELQLEYHNRGYDTVSVTIPQQRLTNGIFKLRVFEGRLVEITVKGNRYYSSNNILRALPGLKTNTFLNTKYLQPQLDLANASQDRQIYPEIHPGPEPDTTALVLRVKDRLPLHAKMEANNESTPGTPDQRIALSAAYDDLWQMNHTAGLQYTFSEQEYKPGENWLPYDQPLVANYSGFYRMPLSSTESFSDEAAQNANKFGYNEATRKFELPPATGATELNLYASRSTIDTGVELGVPKVLFSQPTETISQEVDHEDLTYNENLGFRLTKPLPDFFGIHHNFQIGLDYKGYREANFETNDFIRTEFLTNSSSQRITNGSVIYSPVPPTVETVQYLPISVHWEGTRDDPWGTTSLSLNYSPNLWFTGSRKSFDAISASSASTGFWHVISGDFSREQTLPDDWKMVVKLDGQWASEPLISNEQFGAGGFFGVRGYREGEIFGDDGWRVTTELKVPPYRVGYAGDGTSRPLIVRASFFMDYAGTYLIDPQGRPGATPLWGTGVAGAASLGTHFSGSLVFGVPLLSTPTTEACHPRINFVLTAEF